MGLIAKNCTPQTCIVYCRKDEMESFRTYCVTFNFQVISLAAPSRFNTTEGKLNCSKKIDFATSEMLIAGHIALNWKLQIIQIGPRGLFK